MRPLVSQPNAMSKAIARPEISTMRLSHTKRGISELGKEKIDYWKNLTIRII